MWKPIVLTSDTTSIRFNWYDIDQEPRAWDRLIQQLEQNVFHCADVLASHRYGNATRRGIVITDADRMVGAIGGLVAGNGGSQRYESLSFPCVRTDAGRDILNQLVGWMKSQGFSNGKFGSFDGGIEQLTPAAENSPNPLERLEFLWDIRAGEKVWWEQLRSQHRRNLKKAMSTTMQLRQIERNRAWTLTRLRSAWEQRKGRDAGLLGQWRSYQYHRRLETFLGKSGIGRLYGLYAPDGTTLSIAYMLEYKRRSFYMLGASSALGYQTAASVRLFWELARRYSGTAIEWLNLGGVPRDAVTESHEEHGVYRFKSAYGIEPVARRTLVF